MGNTIRTNSSFTLEVTKNDLTIEVLGSRGPKGLTGNGIASIVYDHETHIITIRDTAGNTYTTDPLKGDPGRGISSISLNNDYTLTITYTDNTSMTTESIKGETGNGIESITYDDQNYTLTIVDTDGNETVTGPLKGDRGETGTTFTPSVSNLGVLSWSNDNDEVNPSSVDIPSLVREVYKDNVSGSNVTINGADNHRYMCGTVSQITINPPQSGTIDVVFTSGSTASRLNISNSVKMPSWFDKTSLDTNTIYEINIVDGIYGAVMSWPA